MRAAIILLAATVALVAGKEDPICAHFPGKCDPKRRIVGGAEATPHQYPWIVDMRRGGHYCGGSIVNEEWVVTAAHCSTAAASNYELVAGDHNIQTTDPNQQTRQVVRIVRHPLYESAGSSQYQYDIALMQVSPPFELNEFVQPITLPELGFNATPSLNVAGWGALTQGGQSPVVLHHVDVPFVSDSDCSNGYPGQITNDMICAGEGGKDSCQGDSGGPLTCQVDGEYFLCGIVSWGRGCAQPGYPGVYTEMSYFTRWVGEAIVPEQENNQTFVENDGSCGQHLAGSSGQVSYKLGEALGNGEVCTWSLRARDQTDIRVEIYEADLQEGDSILVTEIDADSGTLVRTTRIFEAGVHNFSGPVIFLTLEAALDTTGTGFRLHFYGTGYSYGTGKVLAEYSAAGDSGSVSHPPSGGQYSNNELTTIVLNPTAEATLSASRWDVESCPYDTLTVYTHSRTSTGSWDIQGQFCGTQSPPSIRGGPFIMTFTTDSSITYSGFTLNYQ